MSVDWLRDQVFSVRKFKINEKIVSNFLQIPSSNKYGNMASCIEKWHLHTRHSSYRLIDWCADYYLDFLIKVLAQFNLIKTNLSNNLATTDANVTPLEDRYVHVYVT